MNSHDTLNSKKCCLSRNAAVFLVYDRDSGRARWLAIVAAVLTVSASSPRSMEASSRLADASRLSDDGDLTGGRASVQTDAAYSAPLPAPDSYRTGHSMQETNGALDAQARAVFGPEREPNAAAIPPQVAAHALAPSAPGHISTPDEVSAPELPSLGVLSTQEKPAQQAPPPHAASRSVSAASPAWEGGEHASAMELPGTDARTPAPPPALVAQERSPAGQPGASAGEPPMSVRSTNDVRTPEAAPQSSAPASAGATEPHVDVTGQLTPGTVSALADLLSGVSISAAATPPSARRKQDAAVGLVYDEAMERHWGPASAFLSQSETAQYLASASLARRDYHAINARTLCSSHGVVTRHRNEHHVLLQTIRSVRSGLRTCSGCSMRRASRSAAGGSRRARCGSAHALRGRQGVCMSQIYPAVCGPC